MCLLVYSCLSIATSVVFIFAAVSFNYATTTTTEDEEFALTEFRDLVIGRAYREFMRSDGYLIRWLQQTNFHVEEAVANFDKFLEWRKMKNVDCVVFEDFSTFDETTLISFNTYYDKDGRPVVLAPVGRLDFRKVVLSGTEPLYQRYAVRMYELCEHSILHLRATSPNLNVSQVVFLADLAGFNLKTGGCFQCLKAVPELASTLDSNYPGLAYKIYFINTPSAFKVAYDLIVSFLSKRTRASVAVFGFDRNEWELELFKQFPVDQLPVDYGGSQPSFLGKVAKEAQLRHIEGMVASAQKAARKELGSDAAAEEGDRDHKHHVYHHHQFQQTSEGPLARASGTLLTQFDSAPQLMTCFCLLPMILVCCFG